MALYEQPPQRKRKVEKITPTVEEEYYRQIRESGGFDCNVYIRNGSLFPYKWRENDKDEIVICAKVGLHCYNLRKGSTYQLMRVEKYNSILTGLITYYITADVIDPTSNSRFVFQTCVTQSSRYYNEDFRIVTESCRILPETHGSEEDFCHWDIEAVDDFYKGDLPQWLSEDALVQSSDKQHQYYEVSATCRILPESHGSEEDVNHWDFEAVDDFYKGDLKWLPDDALVQSSDKQQQYYEVQDSDILENDWLQLFADYAFFTLWENGLTKLKFAAPMEIMKVVVQTREAMEPKEKLKAKNAIFYIRFRDCGLTEDHRAVVRRTTDGSPEHLSLEVKCLVGDLSSCSIN